MRSTGDAGVARGCTFVVVVLALGALQTLGPPQPAGAQAVSLIRRSDPAGGPSQ
jgi:hypothetical protein